MARLEFFGELRLFPHLSEVVWVRVLVVWGSEVWEGGFWRCSGNSLVDKCTCGAAISLFPSAGWWESPWSPALANAASLQHRASRLQRGDSRGNGRGLHGRIFLVVFWNSVLGSLGFSGFWSIALFLQRAIAEGADFIESDITATKDGKLICFHDLVLDDVTDVASHAEFADRIRTYEAEGETVTGYFSGD